MQTTIFKPTIFVMLLIVLALCYAATAHGQAFQVVGTGNGNLTVQSSGVLSTSTDSGFTTYVQLQSVKYKGNYSGIVLATLQLTTGPRLSGTQEGSARFAPGGSLSVNAAGGLDGTPAENFVLNGTFQSRQTWLYTGTSHVLYAVVKGRVVGDHADHVYSLVLSTTNHGFAGNGYVDVNMVSLVRVAE